MPTIGQLYSSHASNIMLKSLHARLQHYGDQELADVQDGFRKGRTADQIANICWIIEKTKEFQKNISLCFVDYAKAFDCVVHNKLWKSLREMRIPDHLTCLLRNLYSGQEATVRTLCVTADWFKIEKGVWQGCLGCLLCLLNLYTEHSMENARLDELQAGIRIDGRNITNLRYVDDITLMAESKEELKSLLMRMKEESKRVSLRLHIKKLRSWHLAPLFHGK